MRHDRQIAISTGRSRKDINWQPVTMTLSELWQRLETPIRGAESFEAYTLLPKAQQDDKKDIGGFVAGRLRGGRRKKEAVLTREIVTLDMDTVPAYGTEELLRKIRNLGCGFCVYSTRKHTTTAPRLRVLLPLDRPVSADEYEAIARRLASMIAIEMCDPTTFEGPAAAQTPSTSTRRQTSRLSAQTPSSRGMQTGATTRAGRRCPATRRRSSSQQSRATH